MSSSSTNIMEIGILIELMSNVINGHIEVNYETNLGDIDTSTHDRTCQHNWMITQTEFLDLFISVLLIRAAGIIPVEILVSQLIFKVLDSLVLSEEDDDLWFQTTFLISVVIDDFLHNVFTYFVFLFECISVILECKIILSDTSQSPWKFHWMNNAQFVFIQDIEWEQSMNKLDVEVRESCWNKLSNDILRSLQECEHSVKLNLERS